MDNLLEKIKREPRMIISAGTILFIFFPWISVSAGMDIEGYSADLGKQSFSGLNLITEGDLLMIFAFLIPIIFILMETAVYLEEGKKAIYLIGSLAAIILVCFFSNTNQLDAYNVSASYDSVSAEIVVKKGIGFWLTIIAYLVNIGITLVRDFHISRKSVTENGIKGVAENLANEVGESAAKAKEDIQNIQKRK